MGDIGLNQGCPSLSRDPPRHVFYLQSCWRGSLVSAQASVSPPKTSKNRRPCCYTKTHISTTGGPIRPPIDPVADCLTHAGITTSAVLNYPFLSPNRLLFSYLFLYIFTPDRLKLTIMSPPFVFQRRKGGGRQWGRILARGQ